MKRMLFHAIPLLIAFACCLAAQENPAPPSPPEQAEKAKESEASKPDESEKPLRERTIYVPFNKLRDTFEKEGRGVFLPYEQFQQLWKEARAAKQSPDEKRPPFTALITEIESEASVERDVVVVKAKLKLEVLGKGWHELNLRLNHSAIRAATLDGEPARIVFDQQAGHKLLVKNDSAEPKQHELTLEYARTFTKSPGLNSVQFAAPQAPINRWRIRIPQQGVKVNVHPMIAATEVPAEDTSAQEKPPAPPMPDETPPAPAPAPPMPPEPKPAPNAEETVLLAFVGAAPEVRIDWTPKTEGATGLEALATAQVQQEVHLEEGVLRTRVRIAYDISRAELPQLIVEIPADQKVTGVFDPNVRQWEVAAEGDKQRITIQLFEPAKKTQNISIELERFSDQLLMNPVPVPVVKAVGVGRQQGIVVVRIGEELRAEPVQRSGLLQLDAAELPQPLQRTPWSFAYRYASLPFELVLRAEKVKPRIRTEELVEIFLEPEQTTLDLFAVFDIQLAGVFQLEFDVPAGYELRQVRGQAGAGAEAAAVDSHTLEGENKTRLKVNLARKAFGKVAVFLEFHKRMEDANLLSPTGRSSQLTWPIPRTAIPVEGTNGRIIVYAPESLRITPETQTGIRAVGFSEAIQGMESQRQNRFSNLREVLAFVYSAEPVELTLAVERRKPQVDARQLLTARIDSGVVKYEAKFQFHVRYSSVKSLRIDVPTALAAEIRNVTPGIRERVIDPRPEDAAEGFTPWSFTGEREFFGQVTIQLSWEQKSRELEVGKSIDYAIPILKPMNVDRAWGQIVITKAETIDVNAKEGFTGLRPIDAQHDLMDGMKIDDAAQAFEFHEDWSLTIAATRYELEDVKRTSIERAVLRAVVTRSDNVSVQAIYRVRSAVQRLLVRLPEGAQFDTDPLRLNGRAVPLEHGDKDEMYIPLVGQNPDQPFVIELRYTVDGDHSRIDFPVFPAQPPVQSEPAVQKVYMVVYLPDEMELIGSRGPWTSEQPNWYDKVHGRAPERDIRALIGWVTESISLQNAPFDSFATDGNVYTFATLRPAAPPAGSLRLIAIHRAVLNGLVFGGLILVGVVFVRRPIFTKLAVLALIITALVFIGIFAPTMSMQILDSTLLIVLLLIVFLWIVAHFLMNRSTRTATTSAPSGTPPPDTADSSDPRESVLEPTPMDPSKTVDAEEPESPFRDEKRDDAKDGGDDQSSGGANHG